MTNPLAALEDRHLVQAQDWTRDFRGENAKPVPFWDAVARNWDDVRKTQNPNAVEHAYGRRVRAMTQLYDALPGNNEPMKFGYTTGDSYGGDDSESNVPDAEYDAWVLSRRKQDARLSFLKTTQELRNEVSAELGPVRFAAEEASRQRPIASFVGGAAGGFASIENGLLTVGTGGVGVGGTTAKAIIGRVLTQGALNAGFAGALAPGKMRDAKKYGGPDYTAQDAAGEVAGAFIGGAAFEAGGIGLGRALHWTWNTHIAPRLAEDPAARGAAAAANTFARDEMATGPDATGAQVEAHRQALAMGAPKPYVEPERELGDIFAGQSQQAALATSGGVMQPPSEGLAYRGGTLSDGALTTQIYQDRPIHSTTFDPRELHTDAQTFQYKADGDAAGVTNRLKGVEQWDPTSSGKALVWQDAEGKLFIADGHQRRGLAMRLIERGFEADPRLDGYLFRASEGWTARDVRVVAALKNMREGSGTILDAAKLFREAPGAVSDRSLPITGDFIQAARGLARLEEDAFRSVVNKVIPERYGAEIGQLAGDRPDMHDAMVRLMKEADPANLDEARALVKEALLDDMVAMEGHQADLFGGMAPHLTTIARAKLKAAVLGRLRKEGKIFAGLLRNADTIEAGGNVLQRSANEQRAALDAAAAEVVNRLSLRSGPIGEAFAEAARKVVEGHRPGDLAKNLQTLIRRAVESGEALEQARAEAINPPVPADPVELAPEAQLGPKPEDAAIEDDNTLGLFDDIFSEKDVPQPEPFENALARLNPCAPGGA